MKIKLLIVSLPLLFIFLAAPLIGQERIVDNAGLLNAGEIEKLKSLADSLAAAYDFDLVIVTEKSIGSKKPMDFADDFFDYNGYGLGTDRDGCLFLQVTGKREYWFSTSGRGIKILNQTAGDKLEADVVKFLKEDKPYEAYLAYLLAWEQFLELDAKGRSYNFFHQWNLVLVSIVWLVALAIGFIVVKVWQNGMNTALPQSHAAGYVVPNSLAIKEKKDNFLYSRVIRTRRQKQSSSGGGGGVHRSSSGRSHGGRGGRY